MPRTKQTTTSSTSKYTRRRTVSAVKPAGTVTAKRASIVAEAKAKVAAEKAPRTWTTSQLVLAVSLTLNVVAAVTVAL